MFLSLTTQKMQVILGGAVSTNELPWTIDYGEVANDNSTSAPKNSHGTTNGGTAVDMVAAPASNLVREVLHLSVHNADSASATVTIRLNDGGTLRTVWKGILLTLETLTYEHNAGWQVYDVNSNRKVTGGVSSVSNSDGTLTISPTTGPVVASINLTHANSWSGSQTFSAKLHLASHDSTITTDADGATITFDMATSDKHQVTLGGNRTLAVSNDTNGQVFEVTLIQDSPGSRTVTWWSGIQWPGGTAPTLTTTAGKADVFIFSRRSSGVYYGFIVGQNL